MEKDSNLGDQTSLTEMPITAEKEVAESNIGVSSLSQPERKAECITSKRPVPESPDNREDDASPGEAKRLKCDTTEPNIDGKWTSYPSQIDASVKQSEMTVDNDNFKNMDACMAPTNTINSENMSDNEEEKQLNDVEHSIVTFTTRSDLNSQVAEDLPPSNRCIGSPIKGNDDVSLTSEQNLPLPDTVNQLEKPYEIFFCEPCGFQCLKENLFKAHCNQETHLHTVMESPSLDKTLMKKQFSKKRLSQGKKQKKNKVKVEKGDAIAPNSGRFKCATDSLVEKGISSDVDCGSYVVCEPATSAEIKDSSSEAVTLIASAENRSERNPKGPVKKFKQLKTPKNSLANPEKKTLKITSKAILNIIARRAWYKRECEKTRLFRRNRGFGHVKKHFQLINITKKGRAKVHTGLNAESNLKPLCAKLELAEPLPTKCNDCVDIAKDNKDTEGVCNSIEEELVYENSKNIEVRFYCQPCGYLCVTKDDFEKHYQIEIHQTAKADLKCHICQLVMLDELAFKTHIETQHHMPLHCFVCNSYFIEHEDLLYHKTSDYHILKWKQNENASDTETLALQPYDVNDPSLENIGSIEISLMKEEPVQTVVIPIKETTLSEEPPCDIKKSRFHCKKCFYKTRSSTVLTRHIKLRHARDYHFLCKACNIYSMCKEGMEKHIKRSKHIQNAKKNNIGLLFEECIERVWFSGAVEPGASHEAKIEKEVPLKPHPGSQDKLPSTAESVCCTPATGELDSALENAPKRGRPKGNISRMCTYCGLLASSVTNLTVHIRRKHSHQYNYWCKVCNYYTVTKGDMERHCTTKKHESRVSEEQNEQHESIIVVISDGTNFEAVAKKKGRSGPQDNESSNSTSATNILDNSHISLEVSPNPHNGSNAQTDNDSQEKAMEIDVICDGDILQKRAVENGGNKCKHCDFVSHSTSSLEVHVKRKHTKEFEYYCMACEYYAVTFREMTRHVATEKHKVKFHNYQSNSSMVDQNVDKVQNLADIDPKQIIQEKTNEFLEELKGNPDSNTQNSLSHCLEDQESGDAVLDASKASSTASVQAEESETLGCGEENNNHEKAQEIILNQMSDRNGDCNVTSHQEQHKSQTVCPIQMNDKVQIKAIDYKEKPEELEPEQQNPSDKSDPADNEQMERPLCPQDNGEIIPYEAVDEREACLANSNWETDDASVDVASEGRNIVEICDKIQNGNQFDSSIVKLKNDVIQLTASSVGQVGSTTKVNDLEIKPGRRKKHDGNPQGETNRIRCDDCGFMADGLSGLNVHIAMKHPTKEKHFHCLLCGKSFFTESNLHQHLSSVGHIRNEQASFEELPEGGATFKCVKCTEHFDSEQSLFLHIKEQHEELLREVNKYIEEDTEQINREREENQGNICKYCGKICKSSNSMAFLAHIRTHTGSKPFKCKICHFAAAQLGDARYHVKRHLGMREYKCHVCGMAFVMKKHLNTHLLGKHGIGTPKERKFSCNLCDRSFRERWALNNHMKLHTGEKPFKCTWPTCHYSFLTASAMKDHYRTHTGEKSFLCDLCGFAGGTRHALTKHRRQHTGEKPFKCDECDFASTTQSHLTRHKRVHTGEKPYRCPWCEYRSNCAENVRKHILHTGKHEGVKMYNCPKCDYATNAPVEFRNHLKEQHLDIENPDLAYLHAGIVSKSFECRLKGQGANFVESNSPFTAATTPEPSMITEKIVRSSRKPQSTEQVQQVIIIQGFSNEYDGDFTIDTSVEETAAATLQTLAMAGQVARVVHITEDGQVIATDQATHISGSILSEQLPEGATQVVVVEGPVGEADIEESVSIETVTDSSGHVVQQVMAQGILDTTQVVHTADPSSALDALLCAVTELGNVEDVSNQSNGTGRTIEEAVVISNQECSGSEEIQMYHEIHEGQSSMHPVGVVRQVMHSSSILSAQESAQVAYKKMVQGVLQFAVCDSEAADQLMKDGVTQVIVNDEGTVHMVSSEGPRIIMHNTESHTLALPEEHMDIVESNDEISQIIVTEELAQAMVQNANGSFSDGPTHYIVTELPHGDKDTNIYSHTLIETGESERILHAETPMDTDFPSEETTQEVTSMVVYT
ncbi:zinc finger protein 407 [Spea bombifrons]|uniref:zinc finger protein 407 n=1 Tax=Spea bombifrons TaxID=233779 RepID=UPI00234A1435|nr:zinc finger protein 407 [Spea bombifrons]